MSTQYHSVPILAANLLLNGIPNNLHNHPTIYEAYKLQAVVPEPPVTV